MNSLLPNSLVTGGILRSTKTSITVQFDDVRYAISTGQLNGGLHHVLAVGNQKLYIHAETEKDLPGGSVSNFLAAEFTVQDIPINFATALLTSADLDRAIYCYTIVDDVTIEIIATAGIDETAYRPGDGYKYIEKNGNYVPHGTVNLLVFTNKALTDGALVRAMITITEAKSLAFLDMNITSIDNDLPATGTATDGIVLTIDPNGEVLTDSGAFSLFGDTLAKTVRRAVKEALLN